MKSQKGFTLIEVLIAVVILSVGLVAIMQAMGRTQEALRASQNLAIASQILDEQMALVELELKDRGKLNVSHDSGEEKLPGKRFRWEKNITPYVSGGKNFVNRVDVQVEWKEGLVRQNEKSVSGLFTDEPLLEVGR